MIDRNFIVKGAEIFSEQIVKNFAWKFHFVIEKS